MFFFYQEKLFTIIIITYYIIIIIIYTRIEKNAFHNLQYPNEIQYLKFNVL